MGQQFPAIKEKHKAFIEQQKIFFVGTAADDGRVNVSPKGMDSFRVINENRVIWLNVTGSGNETAAHVQVNPRMTIMFNAYEGNPVIMRLYGQARAVHQNDPEWEELYSQFNPIPGARQIFDMQVDMVQTSCGMSVPYFDYVGERELLNEWAEKQGEEGIKKYWAKKNQTSIDGFETHILEKNT
ncbi:pyridoxamine 5'-phosphate oxidase family protein [Teredinibacter sp. KSP-S5-2]|uniref:pyridoxamine 5'-phosphate oxidase family protein n=1 Tax=Teredinibacter sp. KSP-S5-2 TaxID=3034506 RepID=UPI0029352C2B|nr:pyridoxamine 5'-phosphate oxidase family protein [Teredinibacter sp. KSP-S5-2]WNO10708.1 pyridoxamine 5'-phosphate oxidase family protein [Teredinibacter sp. KSP-S5-2]